MRPFLVKFHLYADDEQEIHNLQCSLYDLVTGLHSEGVLLTANKLTDLVDRFGTSPLIKQVLK